MTKRGNQPDATVKERFMRRAIELAYAGMEGGHGGPFGAVVVRDGEVVGEGHNRVLSTNDPTAHAEVTAIRDASARLGRFDLADCEIYVNGVPCPMCMAAVYWSRIRKLYYASRAGQQEPQPPSRKVRFHAVADRNDPSLAQHPGGAITSPVSRSNAQIPA